MENHKSKFLFLKIPGHEIRTLTARIAPGFPEGILGPSKGKPKEMLMRSARLLLAVFLMLPVLAMAQDRPIIIKAGTMLDGKGGILTNTNIVVEGSRISRIAPGTQEVTYDLGDLTVMPGWIDTHVHIGFYFDQDGKNRDMNLGDTPAQSMLYAMGNAYRTLMAGFTTVQSVGDPTNRDLRDWIDQGIVPGPRVLSSLGGIGPAAMGGRTGDPAEIRRIVRQLAAEGADLIKIYASTSIREGGTKSMTDEQIQAACGEAKAQGLRSVVHAYGTESLRAVILAGCTTIEHGNRYSDEIIELMADHGTYLDPHIGLIYYNYFENKDRFFGEGNYTEEGFAAMEKAIPIGIETFKRTLANPKVKIVFGTDAVAGAHGRNYEEFIYRVRDGGQQPMDAIISATSLAAESLNLQDKIGTLAPGMEADIIAVAGNPLEDITAVRRVVFVMKGGIVYKNIAPGT